MHLVSIWTVDTVAGHEISILHRDMPVFDAADARRQCGRITGATLHADGRLSCSIDLGPARDIEAADVEITVFVRPFAQRGERFIPDPTSADGRARIESTFTDPRHLAADEDHASADIDLPTLATLPGAVGGLSSIAYDLRASPTGIAPV